MINFIKKNFPFLIDWYSIFKLSKRELKFIPNHTQLHHTQNRLFADPFEKRGRALLLNQGKGQPYIKKYWRIALDLFQPEIAIDIGANYGEVFLDANYPKSVKKIIAVEANPFLHKYLEKSTACHAKKNQILLLNGLAANKNSKENSFFIDKTSSGRSTALKNNFVKKSKEVSVDSFRIDDIILNTGLEIKKLVFKIDVEGFEPYVLEGMDKLFSKIDIIGCLEFNLKSLENNKIDVQKYLDLLNKNFKSLILKKDGTLIQSKGLSIDSIIKTLDNTHVEGDILLFSNAADLEKFKANFE